MRYEIKCSCDPAVLVIETPEPVDVVQLQSRLIEAATRHQRLVLTPYERMFTESGWTGFEADTDGNLTATCPECRDRR